MNSLMSWLTDLMPPDLSPAGFGDKVDSLIVWMHALMVVLFVGWGLFFLYTLVRYRRRANPKADYVGVRSHNSSYLELAVAIVEGVLLFGLAIPIWAERVDTRFLENDAKALKVRVVAEQFAWNVHYPGPDGVFGRIDLQRYLDPQSNPLALDPNDPAGKDDVTTVGQLGLPVDRPVLLYLTSKDVIHSLFLPHLRAKHDAIPGQNIPLWVLAETTTAQHRKEQFDQFMGETLSAYSARGLSGDAGPRQFETDRQAEIARRQRVAQAMAANQTVPEADLEPILKWTIEADVPDLEIACAQLCGIGHYNMKGTLQLFTEAEFAAWLASKKR